MENYIENENLIEEHSKRSKSIGINTLTYEKHLEDFNYLITEKSLKINNEKKDIRHKPYLPPLKEYTQYLEEILRANILQIQAHFMPN